jgi:hypothetical protein
VASAQPLVFRQDPKNQSSINDDKLAPPPARGRRKKKQKNHPTGWSVRTTKVRQTRYEIVECVLITVGRINPSTPQSQQQVELVWSRVGDACFFQTSMYGVFNIYIIDTRLSSQHRTPVRNVQIAASSLSNLLSMYCSFSLDSTQGLIAQLRHRSGNRGIMIMN